LDLTPHPGPRCRGPSAGPPRCRPARPRSRRCGQRRHRLGLAAPDVPELLAVVEVEGGDGARGLGGLHASMISFARGLRQRGEDAAAVKPAHARAEDFVPVEVARLELARGLVGAVVEDHRRAHAVTLVAVDGGHVRAAHAVVLEPLVERSHAHGAHALGDQVADGIVHHRGGDAGLEAEAVGQVGRDVELAAADVDGALGGLAERDDAGVEAVDEGAETRRQFLKTTAVAIGMPTIIPASALGKNGTVAPSNRIVVGGIGIGPRGREVLKGLPEPERRAVRHDRRRAGDPREVVGDGQPPVQQPGLRQDPRHVRGPRPARHRRRADRHRRSLARRRSASSPRRRARTSTARSPAASRSGRVRNSPIPSTATGASSRPARSGATSTISSSPPSSRAAANSGESQTVHAGILTLQESHKWLPAEPEPAPTCATGIAGSARRPWRPYNQDYVNGRWRGYYDFHGGAALPEWGAHTIDLCQWGASTDDTTPVEYEADGGTIYGKYKNGVKLVMRLAGFKGEGKWVVPGTCPVRYEGDEGWVEAADTGKVAVSSPKLLEGGAPATDGGHRSVEARPRLPRLREDPRQARHQRRHHAPRPHHLPCRRDRLAPRPQGATSTP
jgi:hypothetical protein